MTENGIPHPGRRGRSGHCRARCAVSQEGRLLDRARRIGPRGAAERSRRSRRISSSSTSCSPHVDGLGSVPAAARQRHHRWHPDHHAHRPRPKNPSASSGSSLAPTTTWRSRSAPTSSSPACGALLRRARSARPGRRPRPAKSAKPLGLRVDRARTPTGTSSRRAARDVTLTAKEFLLLEYLLRHRGARAVARRAAH